MKCPHCENEIFPGQFICDYCGKVIRPKEEKKAEKPEKEKKHGK